MIGGRFTASISCGKPTELDRDRFEIGNAAVRASPELHRVPSPIDLGTMVEDRPAVGKDQGRRNRGGVGAGTLVVDRPCERHRRIGARDRERRLQRRIDTLHRSERERPADRCPVVAERRLLRNDPAAAVVRR